VLAVLRQMVDADSPGRPSSYSEAHAFKVLEIIGSRLGVGRQQLAAEVCLGEGTVRTLIRRMRALGLVDVSRGGMTLTDRGWELLKSLRGLILSKAFLETQITVGSVNHAVLVKGAANHVRRGIEQRDAALMAGALGATTLILVGGRLVMPGIGEEVEQDVSELVLQLLGPEDGDAIIIGSAKSSVSAEMGALSAALELLKEASGGADA
jgi:DNA-binding MarR family transcriptional regulator